MQYPYMQCKNIIHFLRFHSSLLGVCVLRDELPSVAMKLQQHLLQGRTLLMAACSPTGQPGVYGLVKWLLENGAAADATDAKVKVTADHASQHLIYERQLAFTACSLTDAVVFASINQAVAFIKLQTRLTAIVLQCTLYCA